MRYAIYYTPSHLSAFERLGATWLGRDAFTGEPISQPAIDPIDPEGFSALTAEPRRYGFHATLKAPFKLAEDASEEALVAAFTNFAQSHPAFAVCDLKVANMKGFLAIVPDPADPVLDALAAAGVREFDLFRELPSADELERRRVRPLSPVQDEMLVKWGYPYVFEEFRFHMTLTGRLADVDFSDRLQAVAAHYFAEVLSGPVWFDTIGLFVEREAGGPFTVLAAESLTAEEPGREKAACLPA